MIPTLSIGPFALPTYPLFLLIAFWVGVWLAASRAEKTGLDGDHIYNGALYGLLAGLVAARLWFVLSHWENYAGNIIQALSLSRSALSAGEGMVIAGLVVFIYLQRNNVPLGAFFDAVAFGLVLALAVGHLGAFLGGEAVGRPASVPWAVETVGALRHPVQLYLSFASLMVLGLLFLGRERRPWPGFHFWLFVALYGVSRLFLEIFRAQPDIIGDGYPAVQVASLMAVVVALAVMAYNFTRVPTTH